MCIARVCVCVCVCVWERETERQRDRETENETLWRQIIHPLVSVVNIAVYIQGKWNRSLPVSRAIYRSNPFTIPPRTWHWKPNLQALCFSVTLVRFYTLSSCDVQIVCVKKRDWRLRNTEAGRKVPRYSRSQLIVTDTNKLTSPRPLLSPMNQVAR